MPNAADTNGSPGGSPHPLAIDRGQLEAFARTVLRHASTDGFISLRSFIEGDGKFQIRGINLNGGVEPVIKAARAMAQRAASAKRAVVFCPPQATFRDGERAREEDVVEAFVLTVDCDKDPKAALTKVEALLGPPTVTVNSGGEWVDPATGEVQPKLHGHWVLKETAKGTTALTNLKIARRLATELVGGDPSGVPAVHPFRWPGSWHRKSTPRLCVIVSTSDNEVNLSDALKKLKAAVSHNPFEEFGADTTSTVPDDEAVDSVSLGEASKRHGEWRKLIEAVLTGESYHGPLVRLAAMLIRGGAEPGMAVNILRAWMETTAGAKDKRWQARYDDIPRAVSSAEAKFGPKATAHPNEVVPVDLWGNFDPPATPPGLLPKVIEDFAQDEGRMTGLDPAGLAMSALVACAAAIRDRIKIKVKKHSHGWTEEARIWVGLIGGPGVGKTPMQNAAMRQVEKIAKRLWTKYLQELERYENLSDDEQRAAEKPRPVRLIIGDTTFEGAGEVFRYNHEGLLCFRDELSGWFGSMEKYGGGSRSSMADRAFWMQAWNGGSYPIDRVGRGFFMIQNLSACLSGGLQPDVLRKIAASAADDGLIQRIIPTICRNKVLGFDEPTPAAVRAYDDLVERLYAMEPPEPDNAFVRFGGGDMTVEFDDGAQRVREEVEKKHFDLTSLECMGKKMTSHVAKYDGYFARLCLIWHCVENSGEVNVPGYVTEDTARRVAKFMHQFLLPHAAEFYNMLGLADDHDRLSNVASFILAKELTKVTRREVQRGDRSMRGLTDRETDAVFEQLEALGWLKRTRGPYHGRGDHWLVNPRCHELFRQRAEREAERRAQQQAVLAEFFGNRGRVLNGD